jgi:hypothetical protein
MARHQRTAIYGSEGAVGCDKNIAVCRDCGRGRIHADRPRFGLLYAVHRHVEWVRTADNVRVARRTDGSDFLC